MVEMKKKNYNHNKNFKVFIIVKIKNYSVDTFL